MQAMICPFTFTHSAWRWPVSNFFVNMLKQMKVLSNTNLALNLCSALFLPSVSLQAFPFSLCLLNASEVKKMAWCLVNYSDPESWSGGCCVSPGQAFDGMPLGICLNQYGLPLCHTLTKMYFYSLKQGHANSLFFFFKPSITAYRLLMLQTLKHCYTASIDWIKLLRFWICL